MKVYIETYGCQMNKLDAETVAAICSAEGIDMVDDMTAADVILLNTCAVRDNAEVRIHGRIGELMSLRRENPALIFGVIGCMAQRIGDGLLSDVVRLVAGPDSYRSLPTLIRRAYEERVVDTVLKESETYDDIAPVRTDNLSAWIAVMRGCDNFCSYCIVPYTRGRERSIPQDVVLSQVDNLVGRGYKEVTLLGQNVNSYRADGLDFAGLLDITAATGIPWVRFLTSHPKDLTMGMLEVMAERENVCRHLHLPIQSGSDAVLKAMNRGYDSTRYLDLIDAARSMIPDVAITTDFIFGFPGETDDEYRKTLDIMERVRFDYAFLYRYSEREGTKAVDLPGSVPEDVRLARLSAAIHMQQAITREKHEAYSGKETVVLIRSRSNADDGGFGFSEMSIPVVVKGMESVHIGDFVTVRITGTTGASLMGELV